MTHKLGKSYITTHREDGELIIDMLFVHADERGRKMGYKLLGLAVTESEEKKLTLTLCAEPDEAGLPTEKLVEYYRNFGFVSHPDCDELMTY